MKGTIFYGTKMFALCYSCLVGIHIKVVESLNHEKVTITRDNGTVTMPSMKTGFINVSKCSVSHLPVRYKDKPLNYQEAKWKWKHPHYFEDI